MIKRKGKTEKIKTTQKSKAIEIQAKKLER